MIDDLASNDTHLEPRVAALEAGLDILTKNVNDLTVAVRDNANNLEGKLERLTIAVTQAQAPKKPEWQAILTGLALILAIGSAAFWPLNKTAQDTRSELQGVESRFEGHKSLDSHPVSAVLLKRLEEQITTHSEIQAKETAATAAYTERQFEALDKKLQTEYCLMNSKIETQIAASDAKMQLEIKLLGETINYRISQLEHITDRQDTMDLQELRAWRNKASRLSTPTDTVPLIPRQTIIK